MSALLAYVEKKRLVMVSDSHVAGRRDDEFPKFQVIKTRNGPAFVGGVGNRAIVARLFWPLQTMCDTQGFAVANLQDFLPGAIDFMLRQRPPEEIDAERDIEFPPATILVGGYDKAKSQMRLWLTQKNGVGIGTTIECAQRADHDVVSLGFFKPQDTAGLLELHKKLGQEGPAMNAASIAKALAAKINETSAKYPDQVGTAAFFAAADENGLFSLPSELPQPWLLSERAAVAR
jgi:hypothetical protein